MRSEPARLPARRRSPALLLRVLAAAAILSLALVPAWSLAHLDLDGLASGDLAAPPKLRLPAVHL
ncbi:MAG: hypothetical protein ACJ8DZ_06230 [Allosphingosinicella sp.]